MGAEKGGSKVDVWAKQRGLKLIFSQCPEKGGSIPRSLPITLTKWEPPPPPPPPPPTTTPLQPHPMTPPTSFWRGGGWGGGCPHPTPHPAKMRHGYFQLKDVGWRAGSPPVGHYFPRKETYDSTVKTGKHSQHCDYLFPGAEAPGHQYPQCRLNSHCIGPVSYKKYHTKSEQH